MSKLRTNITALAALLLIIYAVYRLNGSATGLVEMALPDFPELPAPSLQLKSGESGTVYFASATPFDFDVLINDLSLARPTTGIGTVFLPEQASPQAPVPAMIVVHGSGGISPGREMETGQFLADNGYAAFIIDYYSPRGATDEVNYMLRVLSVTAFDAVTDAYSALKILQTHPDINPSRIGVMGFSYGGMAARFSLDQRIADALLADQPGFAVHVDYYGPCFQNLHSPALTGAPILTLRGTEDASNDLSACLKREAELEQLGSAVETEVYEGAGHAWDNHTERFFSEESPYIAGCEIEYDEKGHSFSGGQYIVDVPFDTSREERIALRLSSGAILKNCVKYGYTIGRDDATRNKSDARLLRFLNEYLQAGGSLPPPPRVLDLNRENPENARLFGTVCPI
jgi:dienelactone hydrolase